MLTFAYFSKISEADGNVIGFAGIWSLTKLLFEPWAKKWYKNIVKLGDRSYQSCLLEMIISKMSSLITCVPKLRLPLIGSIYCVKSYWVFHVVFWYFFLSLYFFFSVFLLPSSDSPRVLSSSDLSSLSPFSLASIPVVCISGPICRSPPSLLFEKMKLNFFSSPASFHHLPPCLAPASIDSLQLILYFISSLSGIRASGAAN